MVLRQTSKTESFQRIAAAGFFYRLDALPVTGPNKKVEINSNNIFTNNTNARDVKSILLTI